MASLGGPNIVTDGLNFYLDAANTKSYPGSGTTWNDISGNKNTSTLINGPTFDPANNGSIVFDGVNDRVSISNPLTISSTSDWTIQLWVKSNQTLPGQGYLRLLNNGIGGGRNFFLIEWNTRILAGNSASTGFAFQTGISPGLPLDGSKFLLTLIGRNGFLEMYKDTIKTTANCALNGDLIFNSIMNANNNYSPGGNISTFLTYNRALMLEEIEQNYRAIKNRFNI